jgi:PAS domain-containing protein
MTTTSTSPGRVEIISIPGSDLAFSEIVAGIARAGHLGTPAALELRLRGVFPRAVVRARGLSGEPPAWYVYRDGRWHSPLVGPWWDSPGLPRLAVTRDGWLADANAIALDLLEIEPKDVGARHFTDFIPPGTLDDAMALLDVVQSGKDLTATILLRPSSGHVIAVDLHAWRHEDQVHGVVRLSGDVEPQADVPDVRRALVHCRPDTDAAFRGYVDLALARMPEPTPEGLAIRLRRLYPHAEVTASEAGWVASREPASTLAASASWWTEPGLPAVWYDAQALIVSANAAAEALLGQPLAGHYWQEFVTPGSTEQVSAMLAILAELGRAESRFRMPRADGSLVEFDSYTEVTGESYMTVMRPRDDGGLP